MTRRVLDTALFHDVASGSTEIDLDRPAPPDVPFTQAAATRPGPLRIAYSRKFPGLVLSKLDAQAARALEETVELLRSLGHEVTERDPEYGTDAMNYAIARYMRGAHDDVAGMIEHPERLERRTRAFARLGGLIPKAIIDRSMKGEQALAERLNRVFDDNDFLITPAVAAPAPKIGALQARGALWTLNAVAGWVPYNGVWNLTGQPAAAVPAGFSTEGLPLRGAGRRPARPRGAADGAGRADRGRAPLGRQVAVRLRVNEERALLELAVEAARLGGRTARRARPARRRERDRSQVARRPTWSARRISPRSARSERCWPRDARTTASSARRRTPSSRGRAVCAGSSTRSTGPSTSCSGSRSGA